MAFFDQTCSRHKLYNLYIAPIQMPADHTNIPFDQLTASETWALAIQNARSESVVKPDPHDPGFEYHALCQAIAMLDYPALLDDIAKAIIHAVRKHFVHNIQASHIPDCARDIAEILLPVCTVSSADMTQKALIISQACFQIAAALLSRMKSHSNLENYIYAADLLSNDWDQLGDLHIQELLTALEPSDHPELSVQRCQSAFRTAPLAPLARLMHQNILSLLIHADIQFNEKYISFINGYTDPDNAGQADKSVAAANWIAAIQDAPVTWLFPYYTNLSEKRRHAVWLIITQKRQNQRLTPIAEPDFASWLESEFQRANCIQNWLASDQIPPHNTETGIFLNALSRRENHDPDWASAWLKACTSNVLPVTSRLIQASESGFFSDFYIFWLSQAWLDNNQTERSLHTIESWLSQGCQNPLIYLQHARILLAAGDIGQTAHAIEMASQQLPVTSLSPFGTDTHPSTIQISTASYHAVICQIRQDLARLALHKAMHAPDIDESLLELAMTNGNDATFAEAALCWFDATDPDISILADYLIQNDTGRQSWLNTILKRKDTGHLDKLYQLLSCINQKTDDTQTPDLILLEAATQMDDPVCTCMTIRRALSRIKPDMDIYWTAVDLWIDLKLEQNAPDEAIRPIIEPLAHESYEAIKALKKILLSIPKQAFYIIQTQLTEELGLIQTHNIFKQLQNKTPETTAQPQSITQAQITEKLSCWLLPLSWQILYTSSRLIPKPTPESTRHETTKAQVLKARGLSTQGHDKPPEPAKWIHLSQPRASDAFD